MLRALLALALVLALLVPLAGCEDEGPFDDPGGIVTFPEPGFYPNGDPIPTDDAGVPLDTTKDYSSLLHGPIVPIYGFASPQAKVEFYDLGEVKLHNGSVAVNAMYFFYDENGTPLHRLSEDGSKLVGWHPVIDVIPGDDSYSPFWRVYKVQVKGTVNSQALDALRLVPAESEVCQMDAVCPSGWECIDERCAEPIHVGDLKLNGIKSYKTLKGADATIQETNTVLNCPIAGLDAFVVPGYTSPEMNIPKLQVWYKRLATYCYLMQGGPEILGAVGYNLVTEGGTPSVGKAYFLEQDLSADVEAGAPVAPMRKMVLAETLPGNPQYTPLVRRYEIVPDPGHRFNARSVQEATSDPALKIQSTDVLHNLVIRGVLPACSDDSHCAATGLPCSKAQGYCTPPLSVLHETCSPWVNECDPAGGPSGSPLTCLALKGQMNYFCLNGCDASQTDTNAAPDLDSRCGSAPGFTCMPVTQSDSSKPSGVCAQTCAEPGNVGQCASTTCGDNTLDMGETCDDGNTDPGDGCGQYCTFISLSPDKLEEDPYRVTCTQLNETSNICWAPHARAEWLAE